MMETAPPFLLVPVSPALPAVRAYLAKHGAGPLDPADARCAARLLEEAVRTGEVLVAFALHVGGRPWPQ